MGTTARGLTRREIILILLVLALIAFLIGAWQVLGRSITDAGQRAIAEEGVTLIKSWNAFPGTQLEGEPELSTGESGRITLRAVFRGSESILATNLQIYCTTLPVSTAWEIIQCGLLEDSTRAYEVIIQRK